MALKIAIRHKTDYKFDRFVNLSPHVIRLRPAPHSRTPIEAYTLKIKPENHFINWQQDPFGNYMARVVFPEKAKELSVDVEVIADMVVINPFDFFVESYAENFPFEYSDDLKKELLPYLEITEEGPLLKSLLDKVDASKQSINDFLVNINRLVYEEVAYSIRMEPGIQTCEQTIEKALGSCRDTGWLLVQMLRHLGLAARFVSGYLVQLKPDLKPLEGPAGPEDDFTDLHAWAEVYVPGAGWIGLDPTSGLFAGEGHIPLACTPSPSSAAPISGYTDKCETEFSFLNKVDRIQEDPRVTKPYTEDQWEAMNALGNKVDKELEEGDVRLTMGGEPTFVSIDDMEADEWNTVADGPQKRKLAGDLFLRLKNRFGPKGLLHYGQGKWYPGEPLPRWSLNLVWRKDGEPIWHDDDLVAKDDTDYNYGYKEAESFGKTLVRYLGLSDEYFSTGYEDVFYYLWEEGNLPVNEDPLKTDLTDSEERKKLAELLTQGLNEPAGLALPLKWDYKNDGWKSRKWKFRKNNMFLIPGTSPMGYRLPLKSLEEYEDETTDHRYHRDLTEPAEPLGDYQKLVIQRRGDTSDKEEIPKHAPDQKAPVPENDSDFFRTALCIEPRDGTLHVFFPPLDVVEHYLELVAAVEATAAELKMPVRIEGYLPPRDKRLDQISLSPDPGVLEINIHPANSWNELVENYKILHDEAFYSRLGTEKFMLDGRHTGTLGGNHITLGGDNTENSPFLREPNLLRSMLTYWQHHPGLSYLFAGEFIGPTSQAPRFDETRVEKVYEMEIAFDQIPEDGHMPFWLTDRLFRHLLTDLTGNTHRSEFCIDKLYSPDSSSGRLGILEMRAFDMPPHYRMNIVQMLLIRTLIARFWKKPYKHKLVRWDTELHDRYMLPHYVESDMDDVLKDLADNGFYFEKSWLDPFMEFRFPVLGTVQLGDIKIELRKGIEPWHVLGEEMSGSGTARYVDSSIERVQVKLYGLTGSRYTLTCNGVEIPLHSTGTQGVYVCGVRYRAWQPPSALHPTIGIDAPLTFDLIDTWNGRSVGGCVYHISHPGGRSYETIPVNANEAEGRRVSRFWNFGHTPGHLPTYDTRKEMASFFKKGVPSEPLRPLNGKENKDYPYTLDMRLHWSK